MWHLTVRGKHMFKNQVYEINIHGFTQCRVTEKQKNPHQEICVAWFMSLWAVIMKTIMGGTSSKREM